MRTALTLTLFVVTLVLVVRRARGIGSAWWASIGAAVALALGLVRPPQAWAVTMVARDALLFLLALLLLSGLLEASRFFEWAAVLAAHSARTGTALLRNVLILGTLITTVLSLDTTAVILTPLVVAAAHRLAIPARPYVLACAFVSNVASLLLPVSNLTNLLLAAHLPAAGFARAMALPQLLTLLVLWAGLRFACRRDLEARFDPNRLPPAWHMVLDRPYFLAACAVLVGVLVGYFAGPLFGIPIWAVTFAGVALLGLAAAVRGQLTRQTFRHLSLELFPFVIGLFVLVQAVENLGLEAPLVDWLRRPRPAWEALSGMVAVSTLASSTLNNLPATLLVRGVLRQVSSSPAWLHAALLGTNVGSCLTPHGSLATLLVLSIATRRGVPTRGRDVVRVAIWIVPAMLVVGLIALVSAEP
jgi:arsenical pump membrane protein